MELQNVFMMQEKRSLHMKMESRFTNTPFTRPRYREKCDVKLPW